MNHTSLKLRITKKITFLTLLFCFLNQTYYNNILAVDTSSDSTEEEEEEDPIENQNLNNSSLFPCCLCTKCNSMIKKITQLIHTKCIDLGIDLNNRKDIEFLCKCFACCSKTRVAMKKCAIGCQSCCNGCPTLFVLCCMGLALIITTIVVKYKVS